jgi:phytoene desaturase
VTARNPGRPPRVVVVGGGIAGLATAALLARGGADVTVLERHDHVGGRAGRWEVDGFRFDTGPSWYFMPGVFEHFFALLGRDVGDLLRLRRLDPAYRVYGEPAPGGEAPSLEIRADAEENWRTVEGLEEGAGEAFRRYAEGASHAYRVALENFLYTTFQRPGRVLGGPVRGQLPELARLLTTSLADHIDATVASPRLRQLLGYHAVFLGSSPYRVPALYSLMSHLDLVEGVLYPDGGIFAAIEAVARAAEEEGARLRLGEEVVHIDVERRVGRGGRPAPAGPRTPGPFPGAAGLGRPPGVARGVVLASGERVEADVVVGAADLRHTETVLLDEPWRTYPEEYWAAGDPGISSLLVYAGVRGSLPELAHHTLFFTRDWPANFEAILGPVGESGVPPERLRVPEPASLYVARPSASEPGVAPAGHENVVLLVPFPADPRIGAGPGGRAELDALADRYLGQVARWARVPDLADRVVVRRVVGPADFADRYSSWRGSALGMEHTLLQSALFRPANASRRVANLLYAGGGTVPGVGLPMCLISAELVAKRLLGETSTAPLPAPLRRGFLDAALPRGRRYVAAADAPVGR